MTATGTADLRVPNSASSPAEPTEPYFEPAEHRRLSGVSRYVLRRLLLIPAQLLFVLLVLYIAINVPATLASGVPEGLGGYVQGFVQVVVNDFTGNWGTADILLYQLPWTQVYAYYIPNSVQIALFALPISAALAYPLSLAAGWSRRPGLDEPARFVTLLGALLPAFVVATLVINAIFFGYINDVGDLPTQGLIPSPSWFIDRGGAPSWVLYNFVTRPTGFPLVDAILHHDWAVAWISFTKTLIQASIVAVAYVAIFFRHARSIVRSASQELHITGARSRGISERTLLWRHTARRVVPSFLLVFALTIPEYLGVQFAVEAAFVDYGFGFLAFVLLTEGQLAPLDALVFLLAILVLTWTFAVDLIALKLDPRGVMNR
jgi:ABC-type dipeptide/oligopeptide/nickel transport system permease component